MDFAGICQSVMKARIHSLLAAFALLMALSSGARAETVVVFAAASLGDVLADIGEAFETDSGHKVVLSLAGTPTLARQIQQGAPADLFFSANREWMDLIAQDGLLVDATRRDFLSNDLVLVGPDASAPLSLIDKEAFSSRLGAGPLAMAFVDAVPAGIYGRKALVQLGLWDAVQDRVVQTDSVRAALALVALREAPLGVVYAADALAEPRVVEVARFPAREDGKVVYSMGLVGSTASQAARAFHAFILSDVARNIFYTAGFSAFGR